MTMTTKIMVMMMMVVLRGGFRGRPSGPRPTQLLLSNDPGKMGSNFF